MTEKKHVVFVLIGVRTKFAKYHPKWVDGAVVLEAAGAPYYGARGKMTDKIWSAHKAEKAAPLIAEQALFIEAVEDAIDSPNAEVIIIAHTRAFGGKDIFPTIADPSAVREVVEPAVHFKRVEIEWVAASNA